MTPLSAPPAEVYWRTTIPEYPNRKMLLRTIGGVAVIGIWSGAVGEFFDSWAPLPRSK